MKQIRYFIALVVFLFGLFVPAYKAFAYSDIAYASSIYSMGDTEFTNSSNLLGETDTNYATCSTSGDCIIVVSFGMSIPNGATVSVNFGSHVNYAFQLTNDPNCGDGDCQTVGSGTTSIIANKDRNYIRFVAYGGTTTIDSFKMEYDRPTATPTLTATATPPSNTYYQDFPDNQIHIENWGYSSASIDVNYSICPQGDRVLGFKTTYTWTWDIKRDEDSSFYGYIVLNGTTILLSPSNNPHYGASQPFSSLSTNLQNQGTIQVSGVNYPVNTILSPFDTYVNTTYINAYSGGDGGTITQLGLNYYGMRAETTTDLKVLCYGTHAPNATPTPTPVKLNFCDGGQEQYPNSECWKPLQDGIIANPLDSLQSYWKFVRNNPEKQGFPGGTSTWLMEGGPLCESGYHFVGHNAYHHEYTWVFWPFVRNGVNYIGSSIGQDFTWNGGTLFWKLSARGNFARFVPPTYTKSKALVYLEDMSGTKYMLIDNQELDIEWGYYHGSLSLGAGTYKFVLDNQDKDNFSLTESSVYYDDVAISSIDNLTQECTPTNPIQGTLTPTGSTTPQTSTPSETPGLGTPSATPEETLNSTITPMFPYETPTSMVETPQPLIIWNCGFENGSNNWILNSRSIIQLAGGPTGPQYLQVTGSKPGAYQLFSVPESGYLYFTIFLLGYSDVELVNVDTGAIYTVTTAVRSSWEQVRPIVYVPGGRYKLELNSSSYDLAALYDGITVSMGGYSPSWCALTPTPGPTSFITPTITPNVTLTPSRTYTLQPSFTPWLHDTIIPPTVTFTPGVGTPTADITQTLQAATLTATFSQGTPGGNGTPGAGWPPDQPPPGSNAPCVTPDSPINIGGWIGYNQCKALNWFAWGDNNTGTVKTIAAKYSDREPMGTIKELGDSLTTLNDLVNSYNWNDTGIPGVNNSPLTIYYLDNSSPYNGGPITLRGYGPTYSLACNAKVKNILGNGTLGQSVCFMFDVLRANNILPWLQVFVDMSCLIALFIYVRNKVVDLLLA